MFYGATGFKNSYFFCSGLWESSLLTYNDLFKSGISDVSCNDNKLRSINIHYVVEEWTSGDTTRKANIQNRYGDIPDWDVSRVTNMKKLFYNMQPA